MKTRKNLNIWLPMLMFLLAMMSTATGEIIFVDVDATGNNDGTSWADAYNYLQDALFGAVSGDEIWVAEGIYKPDQGVGITLGDRYATFQLINGVAIKGGYAGFGEPDPNARDIEAYETILSGDLDGNDVNVNDPRDLHDHPNRAENSYHVVTGSNTDANAILDGFTITAGNANNLMSWPYTYERGGGMFNDHGSPTVTNCTFSGNSVYWNGAAMYNDLSGPTVTSCAFSGNSAKGRGGAVYNYRSSTILTNCTFRENSAYRGGGMGNNRVTSATVSNCTFSGNLASHGGGGIYNAISSATLTNCTFSRNLTGKYGDGGGVYNSLSSPILTNCTFSGNSAESVGGGMYNYHRSNPVVTNCTFTSNTAEQGGGMFNSRSGPVLTNCTFTGNLAGDKGGAIYNFVNSNLTLTNCVLWGDMAGTNGAEIALTSPPYPPPPSTLTISYTDVEGGFIGIYVENGSILNWREGNIDLDPCFVEPGYWDVNGLWVDGDYHLLVDSPCINAGDPNYIAEPNETDLDGKPRVIGGRIDMGAYEYSPPIPAEVRIVPRTINLASKGKWIRCYIWLGEEYDVGDIDPNSVLVEGEIQAESILVDEQEQIAVARFSRSEVQGILNVGEAELTITGQLTDRTVFEGTDVIRVIDKGRRK